MILNIESATNVCSVAVAYHGKILSLQEEVGTLQHAALLTILIDKALTAAQIRPADLKAIAISDGPGSYTSLRVGHATAKGMCYALQIPLIAISTLRILASFHSEGIEDKTNHVICPMIDARRMEVYTALYDFEGKELLPEQAKIIDENSFSAIFSEGKKIIFVGNGAAKTQEIITSSQAIFMPEVVCSAKYMVALSEGKYQSKDYADTAYHAPEYLKSPNITSPKKVF